MNTKILNLLAVITSLFGYLQWGKSNSMFLFEAEAEVLSKLVTHPLDVIHPLTLLPLLGQILLLITLFQHKPSKTLTIIGLVALSLLLGLMLLIGLLDTNSKILASTIPFFVTVTFIVIQFKNKKKTKPNNEAT